VYGGFDVGIPGERKAMLCSNAGILHSSTPIESFAVLRVVLLGRQ